MITEVIQKNEVHVESRLIASVPLIALLNETVPRQLFSYSASQLRKEIMQYGESGYIEELWVEDLV